jgi:hypothetical protein
MLTDPLSHTSLWGRKEIRNTAPAIMEYALLGGGRISTKDTLEELLIVVTSAMKEELKTL